MRLRTTFTAVALSALAAAGCSAADDPGSDDSPATESAATEPTTTEAPSPVALPDGVAAQVGGTEIGVGEVERLVEARLEQVPPPEDDTVTEEQLQAGVTSEVLSDLIVGQVILQGAEELGVAPTDEDVEALRQEVAEGAGGEEAFQQQAEEAGYDEDAVERELRVLAAFQNVSEELSTGDAATPSPEDQQAVQQWLVAQVTATDIAVDETYGVWDPANGQVVPAA